MNPESNSFSFSFLVIFILLLLIILEVVLKKKNYLKKLSMFDFQKLEVYRQSRDFHIKCKTLIQKTDLEKYVRDQLGRASYSIVLNMAEGSAKSSKADRRNFFTISRGSVFECVAILEILYCEKKIEEEIYLEQLNAADQISRMLYAMIKNLSN